MLLSALPLTEWSQAMHDFDAVIRTIPQGQTLAFPTMPYELYDIKWIECDCRSGAYYTTFFFHQKKKSQAWQDYLAK
jgi:hypothetical protein